MPWIAITGESGMLGRITLMMAVCLTAASPFRAECAGSDRQVFRVHVPPRLSITVPDNSLQQTFLGDEGAEAIRRQYWNVQTTARQGAIVSFETTSPFVYQADGNTPRDMTWVRDAQLDLQVLSSTGRGWATVQSMQSSTNAAAGIWTARIDAMIRGATEFTMGLGVTLLPGNHEIHSAGSYSLQVTSTISAP
jgi:hypothetical protein